MLTAPALSMRKCPVMNLVMRLGGGSHVSNATAVVLPLLSRSLRRSQPALKMSSKGPRLGNKRGLLVLSAAASTTSLPVRTTRPSWSPALKTPPESPTISQHLTFTETFHTTSLSNTSEVTGDEGDTSKVNHDEDIDSFFQLADQLVQLENKPRNSTALERQVRQLTVIFQSLPLSHQKRALLHLAETLKVDPIQVRKKSEDLLRVQTSDASAFVKASEDLRSSLTPPYRWLLTQLGHVEGGVKFLVDLRAVLNKSSQGLDADDIVRVRAMNAELKSLLSHWFSAGLLTLEQVTWSSPCAMLQKVSDYEANHPLRNWTDLKSRVGPYRRCFVYTHRSMPGEPIVMLHVALTTEIVSTIASVVKHHRQIKRFVSLDQTSSSVTCSTNEEDPSLCTTAIFYSISSTQEGLQGIDLGNLLIKTAVKRLKQEFPDMAKFSTLSPVPGFRAWLMNELLLAKRGEVKILRKSEIDELRSTIAQHLDESEAAADNDFYAQMSTMFKNGSWSQDEGLIHQLEKPILRMCSRYLYLEKRRNFALNGVANFHLRNGATLWRINWLADMSPRGMDNSFGVMVNYRYFLDQVDANSNQYLVDFKIDAGEQVAQLANEALDVMK